MGTQHNSNVEVPSQWDMMQAEYLSMVANPVVCQQANIDLMTYAEWILEATIDFSEAPMGDHNTILREVD